jgi:hypothetical protein
VIFKEQKLIDVLNNGLSELIARHHIEVAKFKDIKANPDFEMYFELEKLGMFKLFTVWIGEKLIGYSTYIMKESLHYSVLSAYQDALYVVPEERGFGSKFLKWIEEQLKSQKVVLVYQTVTSRFDFSAMLIRNGYEEVERSYVKRLIP